MKLTRRELLPVLGAGALATTAKGERRGVAPQGTPVLPPVNAKVQTTACAYCIVACGYKVYTWPVGEMGGPGREENAFGVDYPVPPMSGDWVSPQMHNVVEIEGRPHHVIVLPDPEATVVNVGGNHSLGGSLARRLYSPDTETADRLLFPQLRIDGELQRITWEEAIDLMARVSQHMLDTRGPSAWGMKTYSYQFYENTFAITKLAFGAVGTPCWAPHDSPLHGSDVPGLSDAGIDNFSAAYQDWKDAEVIFVSGVSLHGAHGILFDEWVRAGGATLIVVDPRRSPTAEHALENGGMHLQIRPGTDTLLHNAIARVILEQGWQDIEFIASATGRVGDLPSKEGDDWRRFLHAFTYEDYQRFILDDPRHRPEVAAEVIGIEASEIIAAARIMAEPFASGARRRTSMMLEKGNYWGFNYPNTASFASLGLLLGAGNRPGRMISRAGGHQRGMIKGGHYPFERSPDTRFGYPVGLNLDRWASEGRLAFAWAIGNTWSCGGTANAGALHQRLRGQARDTAPQLGAEVMASGALDVGLAAQRIRERVDADGLFFVQQDIYPQQLTDIADLVLPAASWGEGRFSRMNGERRLRTYAQIMEPPGECLPDWRIISRFAQAMGYEGFDWQDTSELFAEAGRHSGGAHDYRAVVELAEARGEVAMDLLEAMGTEGIQCPVVRDGDRLIGTVRMHADGFKTKTGKALFVRGDWDDVLARSPTLAPQGDELWITNRRDSATWSAMIEDQRNPFRLASLPHNPLQVNPADAQARGLKTGDRVRVTRRAPAGSFEAVVEVTDAMRAGVACAYFNFLGDPQYAANNVTSDRPDPISGKFAFKLGRGRLERLEG